jgi:guanylate kinase
VTGHSHDHTRPTRLAGRPFVISGPSGSGKGTLLKRVFERLDNIGYSVSATTRAPRDGEVDGVSYHFVDVAGFKRLIAQGELLEWAVVFGNYYGTLLSEVRRLLDAGEDVVLEIDTQGDEQVRAKVPEAFSIFIEPPSLEVLEQRLRARGTESEEGLAHRLETAKVELLAKNRYNAVVTNDDLEVAANELVGIIEAARDATV